MSATIVCRWVAALAFSITSFSGYGQTPQPDLLLTLKIAGQYVNGAREYTTQNIQPTLQDMLSVRRGSTNQLYVDLVNTTTGTTKSLTKSARLRYEAFGCLSVSTKGFMTVRAGSSCNGADYPSLVIYYLDALGAPLTFNSYLFAVTD